MINPSVNLHLLLCIIFVPCFLTTSSILDLSCLHPSTPVASMLSSLLLPPPIWTLVSIIKTDTLSSPTGCPATVAMVRNGSSCSSELLRSRIGSGLPLESSAALMLPLVIAVSMEGIDTPASTNARLVAFRHAARRAPSKVRTCNVIVIVDLG